MLSLDSLDDVVDRCAKVEMASFRALGARPVGQDAACTVFIAGASRAHGFRAELLGSCAPIASGFSRRHPEELPRDIEDLLQAIAVEGTDREAVDSLLEVFYPALRDEYENLRLLANGPGDTFVRRSFRRCRDDVAGILDEARAIGAAQPGGDRARLVHALLRDAGGPFGLILEASR